MHKNIKYGCLVRRTRISFRGDKFLIPERVKKESLVIRDFSEGFLVRLKDLTSVLSSCQQFAANKSCSSDKSEAGHSGIERTLQKISNRKTICVRLSTIQPCFKSM